MAELSRFIAGLPKAELHVHIEGTLEPAFLVDRAAKHAVDLPYATVDDARAAYRFESLGDFLDLYYRGTAVLRDEDDFHDLASAYFVRARRHNVLRAEVFFDPQAHTRRGVPFATVIGGLSRAVRAARTDLGMSAALILCFLRDLGPDDAHRTLDQALDHRDAFIGVGLDSAERGHPPSPFAPVFARARAEGLRVVAHAGEEGPADYIRQALDELGAERIDHGVRCLEDPDLVARLARDGIPLTVCPLSNVRLGVVTDMARHPLRDLMDAGLKVTVNSDDPAYFGGYIDENYRTAAAALELSVDAVRRLARHSFEAAFLPDAAKAAFIARLDASPEPGEA